MAKQLTFNDDGLITESELTEDSSFLKEAIKSEGVYDGESVVTLNIEDVYGNPHQPRKFFDKSALYELAESIKQHGIIQPIVVCKTANKYMIIAGERRYRASKLAGITTIPAIVKIYTEKQIKEVSLIENLQREDLNPIETAQAMKNIMDEFNLTQEELSERLGKSRSRWNRKNRRFLRSNTACGKRRLWRSCKAIQDVRSGNGWSERNAYR